MRYLKVFLWAAISLSLISCNKEISTIREQEAATDANITEDHTIPIETALGSLYSFLNEQGAIGTKGDINDYIDNYFVVSGSQVGTKVSEPTLSLLYAVNFTDENGYALLSADDRIPDEILAVVEDGNICEEDFNIQNDELIPTENDDLTEAEFYRMVDDGILAIQQNQINVECLRYAEICVSDEGGGGGGGGGGGSNVTYHWEIDSESPRLINTAWEQEGFNYLFNKYCPEVGLIWRSIAPAGCVCIAVSQIVAFHEYPSLECNGMLIDYPAIKQIYSYDNPWYAGNDSSKEMLARYVINMGALCNTRYHSIFGVPWGFALPSDAKECLELLGYNNVTLNWSYDENRVLQSLDNGCPVFMSAIARLFSGHAWVIDGYIKRNYVSSTGTVSKRQTLVHCNWGWHGQRNGYYTSGIFHTDQAVISDSLTTGGLNRRYWYAFNTITYDNPNE